MVRALPAQRLARRDDRLPHLRRRRRGRGDIRAAQVHPAELLLHLAVFGTLAVCLFNINIGPMRKAEERAEKTGELDEPGHGGALSEAADKVSDTKPRVINMCFCRCALGGTILATLTVTGNGNPTQGGGHAEPAVGCVLAMLTICTLLCVAQKLYTVEGVINEMFKGMALCR